MTLVKFVVRNYQSLHEVDISLEPFTVIVGATSSGKSAFTRALRTFIANTRGTSFISHGEQSTVLQGTTDTGHVITLTRGRSSAHDAYVVNLYSGSTQERYTKLGGTTPPEVSEVIGIDPKDPLTFAQQFDHPYLLADSPGEVARTFGALTNVGVIMNASREAKRLKSTSAQTLKTRTEDAAELQESIPKFRLVAQQIGHQSNAEAGITRARAIEQQVNRITSLTSIIDTANEVLSTTTSTKPLPTLTRLEAMAQRKARARDLVLAGKEAAGAARTHLITIEQARAAVSTAQNTYTQTLIEAHSCPLCGQSTEHLHEQVH